MTQSCRTDQKLEPDVKIIRNGVQGATIEQKL